MRRWWLVLLLLGASARAQAPQSLSVVSYRVHLHVSEDLEPDLLRLLARPNTVLWLHTRSNALAASVLERLPLFPESYVQLRAPVLESHGHQLEKLPRVGAWLDARSLETPTVFRLGIRPLAVEVEGALTPEMAARVRRAHAARVVWAPHDAPSLLEWSELAGLPGLKLLEPPAGQPLPWGNCESPLPVPARRVEILVDRRGEGDAVPGFSERCGLGQVTRVDAAVKDGTLRQLGVADPALELWVDVGSNADRARETLDLLRRLEAARAGGR